MGNLIILVIKLFFLIHNYFMDYFSAARKNIFLIIVISIKLSFLLRSQYLGFNIRKCSNYLTNIDFIDIQLKKKKKLMGKIDH